MRLVRTLPSLPPVCSVPPNVRGDQGVRLTLKRFCNATLQRKFNPFHPLFRNPLSRTR